MKKRDLKEIRKLAAQLPVFKIRSKRPVKVSGEYLLCRGDVEVNGEYIKPESTYKIFPLHDVDHANNMKDIFKKEGMIGVQEYFEIIKNKFPKEEKIKFQDN